MKRVFLGLIALTILTGCATVLPKEGTIYAEGNWRRELQREAAKMDICLVWHEDQITLYGWRGTGVDPLRSKNGWTPRAAKTAQLIKQTFIDQDVRSWNVRVDVGESGGKAIYRDEWTNQFMFLMSGHNEPHTSLPLNNKEMVLVIITPHN